MFSKEGMKNEVTFYIKKKKGSKSDLQVAVSGWENKVMDTECGEKVLKKMGPKGRILCINTSFLEMLNCL